MSLIGTLNNTLIDVTDTVSQAQFYVWTDGAPRITVQRSGNNIVGGSLINNRLNLSRSIDYNIDGTNFITNALTLNQTMYGSVESTNDLSWVMRTILSDYQSANLVNVPPRREFGSGTFCVVMHIAIVPTSRLSSNILEEDILYETLVFGEFTTNNTALQSITFLPSLPTYPLNMYTGTPFTVDSHPTFYANFSPTQPAYNNHAFLWSAESSVSNIDNILSWQQSPNTIGEIQCVPSCPSPYVCNVSIGLCENNGVRPAPIVDPVILPIVRTSWWRWWMWLIVIVVIIIIIGVIMYVIGQKNKEDAVIAEIQDEDEYGVDNERFINDPYFGADDLDLLVTDGANTANPYAEGIVGVVDTGYY